MFSRLFALTLGAWVPAIVLGLSVGCETAASKKSTTVQLTPALANGAADKLASLLPGTLGSYVAKQPAATTVYLAEARISARRDYEDANQTLSAELLTGNIQSERSIIEETEEHSFLSDTPTYWRTVEIKGRRARIAENRDVVRDSTVYVRVGDHVVARLVVAPHAKVGESADLAAHLDFNAIQAAGVAVAMPESHKRR